MAETILSLGTNLGDRQANLEKACGLLSSKAGNILRVSSVYETEPWGFDDSHRFLNMVAVVETMLGPADLLNAISEIENIMGRTREKARYSPRIIDIDILFYDQLIINASGLTIPHPYVELRLFVLVPLREAAPDFVHPVTGLTAEVMVDQCPDEKEVVLYSTLKY